MTGAGFVRLGRRLLFVAASAAAVFFLSQQIPAWVSESQTFSLKTVIIRGNRHLTSEDILGQIELQAGASVTALNLADAQKAVEQHPYVSLAQVSRKFPASIVIDIIERNPVAYVSIPDKPIQAVDAAGVLLPVFEHLQLGSLPVLTGLGDFEAAPGKPVALPRIQDALKLLRAIESTDSVYFRSVSEIHFDARKGFVAYFAGVRFPVYFGYEHFRDRALNHIVYLRQTAAQPNDGKIEYVDLRFAEQVVVGFDP